MIRIFCLLIERFVDSPTDFDVSLEGKILDILEARPYDAVCSGFDPNRDFGELMRECLTDEEHYERA